MASTGTLESSDSVQRRERVAVAAQACQTCRSRKSKCDEQRPKCGLCWRLNVECIYREPLPTKKDKTMVHILDTLTRLENKFDNLALSSNSTSESNSTRASINHPSSSLQHFLRSEHGFGASRFPPDLQQGYQHLTVPHKIVLWPSIYIHLLNSGIGAAADLQHVLQEGTSWFIRQEMSKGKSSLTAEVRLASFALDERSPSPGRTTRIAFSELTLQRVQEYCDAYFNTFNVLSPVLNRETFMTEIMSPILQNGFEDGESASVLVLLVLALGQVAIEGIFERPVSIIDGVPSGFRGGTIDNPPGLEIFNEARRRIGFNMTQITLETVQIQLLQATYYEATARHLDFWQSTVSASMACQILIKCQSIDWQSDYGDLVKRAFWTCLLSEDPYHLDLECPTSGIQKMDDTVPLPCFHEYSDEMGGSRTSEDKTHFPYHFLAMIALRRLISRIHEVMHETSSSTQADSIDDYGSPSLTVIREMTRQLESWRSLLPRPLQWQDSDKLDFPNIVPGERRPNEPLFSLDQGPVPICHKYNLDIVTAQLRTRFYYARFMIYRPFVYKALHFPELMTQEDRNCCAMAIKSALLWPIALAPPKDKKRIVAHLFAWTQNFLGILLILRMTTENACLKSVCEEHIDRKEVQRTIALMLDWMRDLRQLDGIAAWSWGILEPLFAGGF